MPKTSKARKAEAKQRLYYSKTAGIYDQMHNANTGEHALALRHFLSYANEFGFHKVLDVGCGTGIALAKMLQAGLDARGIEPVRELINVGLRKHKIPQSRIKIGRAEKIAYPSKSFDAVTEFGVLHHVAQPGLAIEEMLRVARMGVFLSDENRFGRGSSAWRIIKYVWWVTGIFPLGYFIMTKGRGYHETEGDGISYSYSVYDSFRAISRWAERVFFVPLGKSDKIPFGHPLFSSSHVMLCAFRTNRGR